MNKFLSSKWTKVVLFLLGLSPIFALMWFVYLGLSGRDTLSLTANPIEYVTHYTGDWTLRFLLITSAATVKRVSNAAGPPVGAIKVAEIAKDGGVWIRVQASAAPKCERCWHHRPEVGSNAEHPTICARCVENVTGPGETRQYV